VINLGSANKERAAYKKESAKMAVISRMEHKERLEVQLCNDHIFSIHNIIEDIKNALDKELRFPDGRVDLNVYGYGTQQAWYFCDYTDRECFGLNTYGAILVPHSEPSKTKRTNVIYINVGDIGPQIGRTDQRMVTHHFGVINSDYLLFIEFQLRQFYKLIQRLNFD